MSWQHSIVCAQISKNNLIESNTFSSYLENISIIVTFCDYV